MELIDEANNPLTSIKSVDDLFQELKIEKGKVFHLLYGLGVGKRYKHFNIPKKSGGYRPISAPTKGLRMVQYRLFSLLERNIEFKVCATGFVKGQGVIKNAEAHKRARWVLNLDIEDFFGTINFGRVRGAFIKSPFNMPERVGTVIAKICTLDNALPQGAPTSPVISNIIASSLDNKFLKLSKRYRLRYTRYADDITLSGFGEPPAELAKVVGNETILGKSVLSIFEACGFNINQSKVRLQKKEMRQEVTGLVVNNKINVPVEFKKNLRTAIHQWCDNPEEAEEKFLLSKGGSESSVKVTEGGQHLRNNIYGRLSYLAQVKGEDDPTYIKLVMKMGRSDPTPPKFLEKVMEKYHEYDVFICHASEDKDKIATPLYDALVEREISTFIDNKVIMWGGSLIDTINHALYKAKLVIAVVSKNSIDKSWPQKEINAVLAREIQGKSKLLVLIDGDGEELLGKMFLLADKLYKNWEDNPEDLADEIARISIAIP